MKSSEGPVRSSIWMLKSSWDHFGLQQGKKMVRVTMESKVPKTRMFSLADIYPLTWSDGFCGGRGKRGALVETWQGAYGREMLLS
jgi:hypothetical protein